VALTYNNPDFYRSLFFSKNDIVTWSLFFLQLLLLKETSPP